ncbi:hypothetical protein [Spiroplasma endosymbiont of Amphibalanus improvisus]|uniref:hypothetical protein n=1 Tax=Spiroplasma endosymbiont of Amphibalanus improvisus TaxID=3066327 RepID=UPI00313BF8D2
MSDIKEFAINKGDVDNKKQTQDKVVNKGNYKKWDTFKKLYLNFIQQLIADGKIVDYLCRKCEQHKKSEDINVYDLMMGFNVEGIDQENQQINKLVVDVCKECNYLDDSRNPYISNNSSIGLICEECKVKIDENAEYLKILNKIFCSKKCVKNFLNKRFDS